MVVSRIMVQYLFTLDDYDKLVYAENHEITQYCIRICNVKMS